MLLGAHESAAGGVQRVFERAARDGAESLQLWTRSSRQWASKPLDGDDVRAFRRAHRAAGGARFPTAAHASYLINLASSKAPIWERSVATLCEECERAEALGIGQVVLHVGASQGASIDAAIALVARGLRLVCAALGARARVRILAEFTAGQGSCLGASFEELRAILDATGEARLGVCLDTQHMFAAGVDWTTERGYDETFQRFDAIVGFAHLEAFHLNDSKRPLGSRVDRHEVIGEGLIGVAPFARLVNDPRFATLPGYLETPPLASGAESYAQGLARLKALR